MSSSTEFEGLTIMISRSAARIASALLVLALVTPLSAGGEPDPVGPKLPPRVRGLLVQEMVAVLEATREIVAAIVRGEDNVVAQRAQAIHDSFILQQEMTEADRRALIDAVPGDFVQRDRAFHALTGELAEAARQGNGPRQRELFARMIEACVACHSRYATDRFPGLAER